MIRHPDDNSMKRILGDLDETFSRHRGHPLRVTDRYPGLFEKTNYPFFYEKDRKSEPVSFLATQPLSLTVNSETVKLCRVGYVYTHEAHRNNGFVSSLLRHVMDHLEEAGYVGAILWTNQRSFYQRLGWECVDPGILVSCFGVGSGKWAKENIDEVAHTTDWNLIEKFRQTLSYPLTTHRPLLPVSPYEVKPSPVSQTHCFASFKDGDLIACLIYGTREHEIYLYEIVGQNEELRLELFLKMLHRYSSCKFYLNLHEKDPLLLSLGDYFKSVEVKKQELQMVYGLPLWLKKSLMAGTIPLIDRL